MTFESGLRSINSTANSTGQQSITTNLLPLAAYIYHVMIIVTSGFSRKSFLLFSEAAVGRCFSKQLLLEMLQYSQENVLEFLFDKIAGLTALQPDSFISISSQIRLQHNCSPENIAKFLQNSSFCRTSLVAAFVSLIK